MLVMKKTTLLHQLFMLGNLRGQFRALRPNVTLALRSFSGGRKCFSKSMCMDARANRGNFSQHCPSTENNSHKQLKELELLEEGKKISITWENGSSSRFHSVWLRFNCKCSKCIQEFSSQRLLDINSISCQTKLDTAYIDGEGMVHLHWQDDDHDGCIPVDYLKNNRYPGSCHRHTWYQEQCLPEMEYEDIISSEKSLLRWLKYINKHGMCLLRKVPIQPDMVGKVAELVGPVQTTIYGKLFGVESTPRPINAAYSSVGLDYHLDLAYYESPPGLQYLHCLKFDDCVTGGENYLINVMAVAEGLRTQYPEDFYTLTRVPATFQKIHFQREEPVYMKYYKPHISINHKEEIINVLWSPQFEGALAVKEEDVLPYYQAYTRFANMLQESEFKVEFKMKPGDLISFNNRTILHARKAFVLNGGSRHLQGCYTNIDVYKNKLCVLTHLHGDKDAVQHVGNGCWL